jgi:hypothetical protein
MLMLNAERWRCPLVWDPYALARVKQRVDGAPVHRVANSETLTGDSRTPPVTGCGWQPTVRGVLLAAGTARHLSNWWCRKCWGPR